jgi:NADH-quinone oxidoreductase subunit N
VGPKAAGLAVLLRTLLVAFPNDLGRWAQGMAIFAALTMTVGNLFALRQTSVKRLLAYSSIAQAGYLLVGVAAAARDSLAVPGLLLYLAIYLFMNLGAFLAVDGIERKNGSDELDNFAGLGFSLPLSTAMLTISLLSLAGFPPFGGFVGKTMLFGAALGAGWIWLAVIMGANVALSLCYYVRVIEPLYLRSRSEQSFGKEPIALRLALIALAIGTLLTGTLPQFWVALASRAAALLGMSTM